ncbi:hypothetical protein CN571_07950 [Bacillus pseudomycoides]|uniref:Uncharacterized protein n=1 Tax=Bacillus pseudomycoides TaxID=64104 RepID=A0AAJ3RE91_9BACI|nr:hypothetical protein [Bacillus pseudomycoides]PDZ11326.1 hypothetical protein CON70_12220 [Bacillus pseudomycoides]PDZ71742.1 hypothetical protein CON58_21755 [Bacillus pseudomycoides]PEO91031.1 hypothetical protein CN571_07950 [Bacillus pseudomycoides]PEP87307.1 hypothetical protein CN584_04805 [Bacillus pseudomycoides]
MLYFLRLLRPLFFECVLVVVFCFLFCFFLVIYLLVGGCKGLGRGSFNLYMADFCTYEQKKYSVSLNCVNLTKFWCGNS